MTSIQDLQRHDIEIEYVENAAEKIVNRYEIILDGIIKKYLPEDSRAEVFSSFGLGDCDTANSANTTK